MLGHLSVSELPGPLMTTQRRKTKKKDRRFLARVLVTGFMSIFTEGEKSLGQRLVCLVKKAVHPIAKGNYEVTQANLGSTGKVLRANSTNSRVSMPTNRTSI